MADAGPTRSDRDRLKGHRAEKPYDRVQPRPSLRRSTSIVESLKSIVIKPFSWLTSASAGPNSRPTESPGSSPASPPRVTNGKVKRKPSSPDSFVAAPTPKKRRRGSPNTVLNVSKPSTSALRSSVSVPLLNSQSATLRLHRATFLPPLPRMSTPSRQNSVQPTGFASPIFRASPSAGSAVFAPRATSITPRTSFDEATEMTAFGLRYRSPFMPKASPAPPMNPIGARAPSLSRQSSIFPEGGGGTLLGHIPKPRATLSEHQHETERTESVSPTRPYFSPATSPLRRLSDSVNTQLVPPFQSTTLKHTEGIDIHSQQRLLTLGSDADSTLAQAHRAVSYVATRSTSPEKMSTDRVFQALEEALPWSQSRKLRHEQRAKIKVPVATTTSKLGWRAGRMVKPYGGSHQRVATNGGEPANIDAAERARDPDSPPEGLLKRSHTTKGASPQETGESAVKDENVPLVATRREPHLNSEPRPPTKPPNPSFTASTFLPPLHSIVEDQESTEPLPFALVPTNAAPANVNESNCSQEPQSSLPERRSRTFAVHASSVPRRPTSSDKRPNRFALDDGEDIGGEMTDPEETELKQWASKSGIALEVPTGWSFGTASSPAATKNPPAMAGQKAGDGAEITAGTSQSKVQSNPAPPLTLPSALATDPSTGQSPAVKLFAPSSSVSPPGIPEGEPPGIHKVTPSRVPPVAAKTTSPPSLFSGLSSVSGNEPSLNGTKPVAFSSASASMATLGKGPSPFGNTATKSTPFGTPGIFASMGAPGPPFAANGDTNNKPNKPDGEASAKMAQFSFAGFGGTPIFEGAAAGKPTPSGSISQPPPFGNTSQPLLSGHGSTRSGGDSREIRTVDHTTTPLNTAPDEASAKPPGPVADSDEPPAAKPFSTSGATRNEGDLKLPALQSFGTPSAPIFGKPSLPEVPASQTAVAHQTPEPAKPFAWPNTHQNTTPPVDATQSLNVMGGGSVSSRPLSGPSESVVPPPTVPQITPFAFGTSINGTGVTPAPTTTSTVQPPQIPPPAGPSGASLHTTSLKFGLSTLQNSATDSSTAASNDAKPEQSNLPAVPSVFSFGNSPAPASVGKATAGPPDVAAVPPSPFVPSSNATLRPAFPFGASSNPNSFGSDHTPRTDGPRDGRPTTPPPANNDNTMETSPVQSVATSSLATNGENPFAFGSQTAPSSAAPAFTFGSTQSPHAPGATSGQPSQFSFSSPNQSGTPSKSFGNPRVTTQFGSSTGAPSSPFGAAPHSPASAFTFGSSGSQPPPPAPSAPPAFSFNFSPAASPTLSPATLGGGTSAPFVFGAGTEGGSQTPVTPTTPNRRPLRGLPQRKKR